MNYASAFSNTAPKTQFTKAAMEAPLILLDRALTYFKGAFMGCDGILSWTAGTGTLAWSGKLHIYFTKQDGTVIHNEVAIGSVVVAAGYYAYVDLSETNNATVTAAAASLGAGSASTFKAYNRLCLGYRNTADNGFYPEELAGVFAQMLAGSAYVEKATYDAQTILAATTNDTPAALTVTEQTLVGRITGGNIAALSVAQVKTLLAYGTMAAEAAADYLNGKEQEIACADNVTINWSAGGTARMTFDRDAVNLTLSNGVNGKVYRLLLKQSAGGSDTISWVSTIKWRGGSAPTLTTTGNGEDILTFVYINGAWYADAALAFASV